MFRTLKYVLNNLKGHNFISCNCHRGRKIIFPLPFWVLSWSPPVIKDRLRGEKQTEVYSHVYLMYAWEIPREKWGAPQCGLKFRLNYRFHREREVGFMLLSREWMVFRKDKWVLRRIDGKHNSWWQSLSGCGIDF